MAYADDMNPLGDNCKENTGTLNDANEKVSKEGNSAKSRLCYCLIIRFQGKIMK
jgi:hypothetical protein